MNNLHLKEKENKSSEKNTAEVIRQEWEVDKSIIEKNPKIDTQLLADLYQSVDGVIQRGKKKGANYNLSHPLGSNVVPTPRERKDS